jgi:tetratricopeptide (TPR) repeat protein
MAKRSKTKPAAAAPRELVVPERLRVLLEAALIIGLGLWIYAPAFRGDWLWDDDWYITRQPLLRDIGGLWKIWVQPGSFFEYYPIEETLLWMQWHLWGTETLGYHLTTVALHIANALMVWRLLDKLGLRKAWLGGLLFAVHPVMVDSVAWIAETKNTLSLLPFLFALCAWIDYEAAGKSRDYVLALGLFTVAMLCKITMAPFFALILLYAWWKRGGIGERDFEAAAPFFVVAVVLGWLSLAAGQWYNARQTKILDVAPINGFLSHVALAGQALAFYFSHCFWPVNLLPTYPQWTVDPASPLSYLAWPIVAGAIYWLWRRRKSWGRHALLGMGFFLIFLAPFVGFITVSYMAFTWVMDHFLYIPLIGIIGLVVAAIGSMEGRLSVSARPIIRGLIAAMVGLLALEARGYTVAYTDEATLWGYAVERNPNNWMAQDNLAKALLLLNRPQEAAEHFAASLQLRPGRAETYSNLGRALVAMDRVPEALAEFDQALANSPADPEIYNQKGVALLRASRFAEAQAQFERAIQLRPSYAIAIENLGTALAQSGHLPEAIAQFTAALRINPDDADNLDNVGSALLQSGRTDEAVAEFQRALQINPDDARAQQNLANLKAPGSNTVPK